jgi:hypothetical protein
MIVPWLSGQVAALAGLRWVFGLVSGSFAAILLLSRSAKSRERLKQSNQFGSTS